jgi:hypothetical protein
LKHFEIDKRIFNHSKKLGLKSKIKLLRKEIFECNFDPVQDWFEEKTFEKKDPIFCKQRGKGTIKSSSHSFTSICFYRSYQFSKILFLSLLFCCFTTI